jgi:hypothetical protein
VIEESSKFQLDLGVSLGNLSLYTDNGMLIGHTQNSEDFDLVMYLHLTKELINELEAICSKYDWGDYHAVIDVVALMQEMGAERRIIKTAHWWLEGFRESFENYPNADALANFDKFFEMFWEYRDDVLNGEDDFMDSYPDKDELRELWLVLKAEENEDD